MELREKEGDTHHHPGCNVMIMKINSLGEEISGCIKKVPIKEQIRVLE